GAGDGASQGTGVQCGPLGFGKPGQQPGASRLGDAVIDGSAQQGVVSAGQGRDDGADLRRLVKGDLSGNVLRQYRPRFCGTELLVRPNQDYPQLVRHRELNQVERIQRADQHDPAKQGGSNIVGMPAGDRFFRTETCL